MTTVEVIKNLKGDEAFQNATFNKDLVQIQLVLRAHGLNHTLLHAEAIMKVTNTLDNTG